MPFFDAKPEPSFYIDPNKFIPVSVIVNFAPSGKFVPIYIRYIHPDQSEETIKIEGVKSTKDIYCGVAMYCYIVVNGYQKEILLQYYYKECKWFMAK